MAKRSKQAKTPPADENTGEVPILRCSADAALRDAWSKTTAPPHFRLRAEPQVRPEHLDAGRAHLVLVDAETAEAASGPLAEALDAAAERCVWTGAPQAIDRLGPLRVAQGYDIIPTPTTPGFLAQRLAAWERSIRRTSALEEMGRRVEQLAQGNERLASRLAAMEAQLQAGHEQHERLQQVLDRIRQVGRLSREVNTLDFEKIVRVCIERLPALVEAASASLY
ncbi:MAG: hypothetical protein NTY65_05130, partial [Planctomycetota bacterium]|nr:hypothetical protein [Planctomycetota bacterium]